MAWERGERESNFVNDLQRRKQAPGDVFKGTQQFSVQPLERTRRYGQGLGPS